MNARSFDPAEDRIVLSKRSRVRRGLPRGTRRSPLWTIAAGVVGSTILLWVMVQLGQASPNAKGKQPPAKPPVTQSSAQPVPAAAAPEAVTDEDSRLLGLPAKGLQGPALEIPREVLGMLDLRKHDLDRREEAVRRDEERLLIVRDGIEKLLAQNEALEKRIIQANSKEEQKAAEAKAQKAKALIEKERHQQEQKAQLAKMYEAMPSEDAAARLERMPDRNAIEILRLIKTKTAGAILAQVKPDRAAKLTEQLLAQAK